MGLNVTIIIYSKKGNKSMKAREARCSGGFWDIDDAIMLIESMSNLPVKETDFDETETETETVPKRNNGNRGRAYRRNERNKHIAKRKRESDSISYDGHGVYKYDGQLDKGNGIAGGKYRPRHGWKTTNTPMTVTEMKVAAWDRAERREKDEDCFQPFYSDHTEELMDLLDECQALEERRRKLLREVQNIEYDLSDVWFRIKRLEND
jgi:hypothetical protein